MQYTQEELEKAFTKVQNKEHWKNPIDKKMILLACFLLLIVLLCLICKK
ncbi:MAG: hypothetical protein Q7R95_11460 [bacterium]|nr:hypothetical protein [bacterium]